MNAHQGGKILLLDNYDSFTHNLLHALKRAGIQNITLCKNDEISLEEAAVFSAFVISPGPGSPSSSGICCDLIRTYAHSRPILGICLGHQAIAEVFGARLFRLRHPQHGIAATLKFMEESELRGYFQDDLKVGLYHSWAVDPASLNRNLVATAFSDQGIIMSIRHRRFPTEGWQFHPESVMTPMGDFMLRVWGRRHQLISHS